MTASNESYEELQKLQRQIDHVLDKSLLTTQRMVRLCHKTEKTAIKSFAALGHQKEQLCRAQNCMTTVRSDLKSADRILNGIQKLDGTVSNLRKKSREKYNANLSRESSTRTPSQTSIRKTTKSPVTPANEHTGRITGDRREEEAERNVEIVNSMLSNLKVMAMDLVTEVRVHEEEIKLLSDKVDSNQDHVTDATRRTNILVTKSS